MVRVGAQPDQSVVARRLCDFVMVNCASPAYLERYGVPERLEDLAQHRLIHYVGVLGARSEGFVYEEEGKLHRVPMAGSVTVNSTDCYESACKNTCAAVNWWRCWRSSARRPWRSRCCMPGNGICRCGSERSWTGWGK
ncbi:hypothetical protein FQ185_10290 [Pseudomonas sp. ANT_H12B]|nr:hypothetical protein FQ185_10290 [Pseudomonas sp. ANT_H12B]